MEKPRLRLTDEEIAAIERGEQMLRTAILPTNEDERMDDLEASTILAALVERARTTEEPEKETFFLQGGNGGS